jgi:hypothetical protein
VNAYAAIALLSTCRKVTASDIPMLFMSQRAMGTSVNKRS